VAQVFPVKDKYQANLLTDFDGKGESLGTMEGAVSEDKLVLSGGDWTGKIEGGRFTGEAKGDKPKSFEMKKVTRESPALGAKPPEGAIALFDGSNLDQWQTEKGEAPGWKLIEGGAVEAVPKSGSLITKKKFKDYKLHVEFHEPLLPDKSGQGRGNSGVYLQQRYEIQILDSYGLPPKDNECGGIYKITAPRVNACRPPLQWQTYDITFHAPRFDKDGAKTSNARVTVVLNGVTIHDDQTILTPTGGALNKGEMKEPGSLLLQEHGNPIQFRNVWIEELKD